MSFEGFEAVPCMFKQRQEDGAEVGLFGLLIRPSPSSSNIITAEGQKQQPQPSSSSSSPIVDNPQLASSISALAGPSSIQIVPNDAKKNDHQNLNIKRTTQRPIAFAGPQMVQRRGPFPLSAPPGMPPILPRPKKGAQKAIAKMIVPITATSSIGIGHNNDNITAQSPSQVVPQSSHQVDILSIATTSSASIPSSASSISPISNNSIPSPSAAKREKSGGKKQQKGATEKRGEGGREGGGKLAKTTMAANTKRRRPQKEKEGVGGMDQHQNQQNNPIHSNQNNHLDNGGGGMLGEDLHSIEFSQLVNSTVITTEDYLPSQSEPIYTNLDMYNPGQGPSHQNAHSHHSNHHFVDPPIPVPPPHSISGHQNQQQLCPSAIYLHNQHQQQHFPCPTSSSSSNSQIRFIGPSNAQIHPPPQYIPQSAGQSSSHQQSSSTGPNQPGWHPYLVAHPGGSHISSTPDSGIQSIDGSPPSVYTPPMVSPYSSQVRSCESIGPNVHCNNGGGNLLNNGGHPPPPIISTAYSHPSHSMAQMNGICQGETSLLLMSSNSGGNGQHELAPNSTMQMAPIQQQLAPPKLIDNGGNGRGNEGEEEDGPNDFSDMPKLIPISQMMENDETIESEQKQQKKASLEEREELVMEENIPSTSSMAIKTKATIPGEVFFNSEMNLQELVECLTSNMDPEQLKKLTSLIQSKTGNCANNNSKLVEQIGSEGEKLAVESQQKKRKEKKANNILEKVQPKGSKSAEELAIKKDKKEKREREKMVTSKQSTELKTKCENIDTKVHSKEATTTQQNEALNSSGNDEEEEILKRKEEEEEKERIGQLIAHRKRVKAQLKRKLEEFTENVRQQYDQTHLDIPNEYYWPMERKFPLRKLDWNEVEKRMAQKKENGIGIDGKKVAKRRGRKRKEGGKEIDKRKRNIEEEREDGRKKAGRKRKRTAEDDEKEMRRKRKRTKMDGSKETMLVDKQKTPPIILKLPNLLNRRKNHPPNDSSKRHSSRGSSNEIIGRHKMALKQQQQQMVASTSFSSNNNCQINKMSTPPTLFADQLAIIRSKHSFLPRNLKRKTIEGNERRIAKEKDSIELVELLKQIFDDFRKICHQKGVPKRHIHQLERTIGMLFSQQSTSQSSATLLDQFDGIIKQMISTLKIANLRMAYLQLKRSANFGIVHPQLKKEHLQMFTEDRRRSIHPPNSASTHASPSKRIIESAITAQRPLTVDTNLDLSYMDSEHPVGRWDPDKEAKLSPNSDNREHDCVRCICGMAEDDGVMTQCDGCHFWLHADCLDNPINEDQEYICDFCTRQLETTPRVDIVLRPQPAIKFSGCTYYRTLVNARGLQIRLNEAIYVERLINDKHKKILRELHEECVRKQQNGQQIHSPIKKNGKRENCDEKEQRPLNEWWTENGAEAMADRREFHRRDLRVFRVERLFISPNGQRFIFGCYYARPHETFCDSNRMFYRNELFWTPLFDTLPLDSVVGRCLILEPQIWAMGRPKSPRYLEEDVYCCEYQIDRNQRSFEKIQPKNRYYINTEPYVFNTFAQKLPMKRDFTPFQLGNNFHESSAEGANAIQNNSSPKKQHQQQQQSMALAIDQRKLYENNLEMICKRIIGRRKEWPQQNVQ